MKVCDRDWAATAVAIDRFDGCVERPHRNSHVAGMSGDTGFAASDDCMLSRKTAKGRTSASRLPLVARLVGVIEIRTARALEEIARGGGLVSQLTRRPGDQGAGKQTIVATDSLVACQIGIADQSPYAQTAIRGGFDLVETNSVDVDEMRRVLDLQLHQVQDICPAGDEFGFRIGCCRFRCRLSRCGSLVCEGSHASIPPTSAIASRMFE
ncbi:hypothetical protein D3C87_1238500 [compost metagenome]